MAHQINDTQSLVFNPTSYTGASNIASENSSYPFSNGYNSSSYTRNYARIQLNSSNTSTTCYIYYTFNVSGIPSGATINSVTCSARISKNSRVGTSTIQLYNGTTAKGSSTSFSSTSTTGSSVSLTSISSTGSWTISELNNIRLRISGVRSNTNQTGYIYFWGADLTINYTYQATVYEITSVLDTNNVDSIDPEGETDVVSGDDYTLVIDAADINDFIVEDNGVDVTSALIEHESVSSGSVSRTPLSTYTEGFSASDAAFYNQSNTNQSSDARLLDPIGYTAESPNTTNASSSYRWTYVKNSGNSATGWINYQFDFSDIPVNATITNVEVKVYGARESSTTSSTYVARIALYSGNTQKSADQEFTSTTNGLITKTNPGTWTRAELQNAQLRFTVGYYGGWIGGITWKVDYTVPTVNPYYYTYTLSNVSADHIITVKEAIIEIPVEDPQYEYYSLTISSANATTDPRRGTYRVVEGTDQTITITPTDPQVTLILDNGVDVSSQLVSHAAGDPTYTVTSPASGASYGFNLNSSTGYYTSNNNGVSSSAALCRVNFSLPVRCLITIKYINYAEATYDFGVFSKVDTALSTTAWTASSNSGDTTTDAGLEQIRLNTSAANTSTVQTLTYEIPAGEHFIDVKFGKDQGTNSNNDNLQFKIESIQTLEANNYYTYSLTDINEDHSLVFVFGDIDYYFITSTGANSTLYPSGQYVALDGDSYRLTIVPNNYDYTLKLFDNGTDVTSNIERKEVDVEKNGETITVVNFIYTLSNINANHTLTVECYASDFIKINGTWRTVIKFYRKENNSWREANIDFVGLDNILIYNG